MEFLQSHFWIKFNRPIQRVLLICDKDANELIRNFIVHLDLKGAPPTVAYLVSVFPLFKKLGYGVRL